MNLLPCPHCGSISGVYKNVRAFGWYQEYYNMDGDYTETDLDALRSTDSKTLRCSDCLKIRRDVLLIEDDMVVPKKG